MCGEGMLNAVIEYCEFVESVDQFRGESKQLIKAFQ